VNLTADRKRKRKERTIVWTTKAPPTARLGPQDIMSKPETISDKAKDAKNHLDLWSLFVTPEMQAKICTYTNTKIEEDIAKKGYTQEDLASKAHIKPIDKVKVEYIGKMLYIWQNIAKYLCYFSEISIFSKTCIFFAWNVVILR
jgi:hypothetical protein